MLVLPDVTLCCIDTANHRLALRALEKSVSGVRFARALLVTDALPEGVEVPPGIEVVEGLSIRSRDDYSQIVLKSLLPYCPTSHILLIQWDGYVVHPEAWTPAFLDCDYLGAKWFWHDDGMTVGNGGFSLRSRRLLEALQDPRIILEGNEDETICRHFRPLLEREHRIRFGDEALADRFSFEGSYPVGKPFGFHALFNFWRVMPADEVAALVPGFSDAIARSPQLAQLMRNCAATGLWPAATAIASRILAAQPGEPEATTVLEQARAQAGRLPNVGRNDPCPCGSGRKFKHCHGSLDGRSGAAAEPPPPAAAPPTVEARLSLALGAHQRGDLATAEQAYRSVLSAVPEHPVAMHYLGVVLYQRGEVPAALPLLDRSAALVPQEPEFHNNLGLAFAALDRHDDAIAAFRRSLAQKPDHAVAWNNLGLSLQATGRVEEAVRAYREAIAKAPQFGQAHWNLAVALLTLGAFAEGWREYESRLALAELGRREAQRPGAPWPGRIEAGRRLLLTAEQGIGDAVQFIRFARPLAERGMHVIVEVPPVLRTLAATAPGVDAAIAPGDAPPAYDYRVPLLSVPGHLGVDAGNIPADVPYLRPEPARRTRAREALQSHAGRLKVGLCWAGNPAHTNDRRRSLPLAALAPLLAREDLRFFSLQKDSRAGAPVIELPLRSDFDDLAALVAGVDLVISVDTAVAHLAGALARPTWVLLPFAPDWRWRLERTDSAWYPTMRLFRQPAIGDWAAVIRAVDAALESFDRSCVS